MRNSFFFLLGFISMVTIFIKVKNNLFSEEKSILWMFGGVCLLIISISSTLLDKLAVALGIAYGPSLLFLLSTIFILYIIFKQEQQISLLDQRVKELSQKNALLEFKVRFGNRETKI